jgi:hypothetical protein
VKYKKFKARSLVRFYGYLVDHPDVFGYHRGTRAKVILDNFPNERWIMIQDRKSSFHGRVGAAHIKQLREYKKK